MTSRWNEIALKHGTNKATDVHGYVPHYERLLGGMKVRSVLELGVFEGNSLRLWRDVWPTANIVGVDCDHVPPVEGCTVIDADCTDVDAMADPALAGPFDIIVDDASHKQTDTIASLDIFLPRLTEHGVYIVEDVVVADVFNPPGPFGTRALDIERAMWDRGLATIEVSPGLRWTVEGQDYGRWAFVAGVRGGENRDWVG